VYNIIFPAYKKLAAELKRGRDSIGYDERPGRPKEATNDKTAKAVHDLVMCDRRQSCGALLGQWV
jgi:hypothetical protein